MSNETYQVVRRGKSWAVDHDGQLEGDYVTKEAAFEAIVAAASNAIEDGYGIAIKVPQREAGETAVGGRP